jgi:D-alanyl-D-alanine carboxypeptidase
MVLLLFVLTGAVVGVRALASGPGEAERAGAPSSPAVTSAPTTSKPTGSSPGASTLPSARPSSTLPAGAPPLPDCRYWDIPARQVGYGDWDRTLLDTAFTLPEGYEPPGLVPLTEAGFQSELLVRRVLVRDLQALRKAAQAAGNPVEIIAAYRTYTQQALLFDQRVAEFGEKKALRRAARAGHSEHQLGTAVDFKTAGARSVSVGWGSTPAGRWTARNAHRFGFVMSYPWDKASVTCYSYEPWHFRYFGREVAARIRQSGLTVREFLWAQETDRSSA